jgi:hypothetical protein
MWVWVLQLYVNQVGGGKITATYRRCNIFVTEAGYNDFKSWLTTQTANQAFIYQIAADYGRQKWYNDKVWFQLQMNDMFINGNFIPNLQP